MSEEKDLWTKPVMEACARRYFRDQPQRCGKRPCKECLRDIGIEVGDDNDEFPE